MRAWIWASHRSSNWALRRSKSLELPEPCLKWVPSKGEPERSDMLEDGEEIEDEEEVDNDDSDMSASA